MDPKTQPENQQQIVNNVTNPTQPTNVIKEDKEVPTVDNPHTGEKSEIEKEEAKMNHTQNTQNDLNPENLLNNEQKEQKKENAEALKKVEEDKAPEKLENKEDKNQKTVKDASQQPSTEKAVHNSESQPKTQPPKEKQKDKSAASSQNEIKAETKRSETNKDATAKAKKKESQDLKDKDTKLKKNADQENKLKPSKGAEKETTQKPKDQQKKPEPTLGGAFRSILNFFTTTKNKIEASSGDAVSKLKEVVLQSKIVSTITGVEYKSVISSDLFKKAEAKGAEAGTQKTQKSRVNKAPGQKAPVKNEPQNAKKNLTTETKDKTLPTKESIRVNIKKTSVKPKPAEAGGSPIKGRSEVEEQIRIHKIQEVKKMKKALLEKIDALNDQLFELEKPTLGSQREGESPVRAVFNLEQYKKEQKEELEQKKRQALEFAKKMHRERNELEQRREKRRDYQHALAIKDIDVFYQKQLDELATLKGGGSAKSKFEENIKKFKQENMFSSLEEKKKGLKIVRGFNKNVGDDKEEQNEDQDVEKKRIIKKPLYKSPVLAQVLKEDETIKKVETEKAQAKKDLYKKKLEYAKEVKSSYLPQVHTSKYLYDSEGRIARAVYRSQNIEKNLIRNAGKDALYGYLEKMRNKYPDLGKVRKDSEDEPQSQDYKHEPVKGYGKVKSNKSKAKYHQEEDEGDYYGEEDMKNYELEEDVNLTDRADNEEASRDLQPKNKVIKNLKNKSYQPDLKRKSVGSDEGVSEDSRVVERNSETYPKFNKKHQVEQKGFKDEEENEWEEELRNDQLVLKDKISAMLGDIKKMESQMKKKEQMLLQDIEKKKNVNV